MQDWKVYDRPELQAVLGPRSGDDAEALIALDGMHCASCVTRVERLLSGTADHVNINLAARTISFHWHPSRVAISAILQSLDDAGFLPQVIAQETEAAALKQERRSALARIGVATICAMQVMMLAWPAYSGAQPEPAIAQLLRWGQWLIATPAVFWAGWPFFTGAAAALRARALGMDVPVALAIAIAYAASALRVLAGHGDLYFDTATMFVWLLLLGRFLEQRTRRIAGERLRLLAGRRALTASRRRGNLIESVPITALAIGDEVVVPPGEAVPADGELLDAAGEFDESLLTGESRPVAHRAGEEVIAGSLNAGDAAIALRTTRIGSQTTLSQILHIVDTAQQQKSHTQQVADRLAGHFVLAIIVLALVAFLLMQARGFDVALNAGLAVLVASCPCALSLAIPIALAAATSRLARDGVLVAHSDALLRLADVDTAIFDKTGTLTQSRFSLVQTVPLAEIPAARCLEIASALEAHSRHPIAAAFSAQSGTARADDVHHTAGSGIDGRVDGRRYRIGAAGGGAERDHAELSADADDLSWIALFDDTRAIANFGLRPLPRAEAGAALDSMRKLGVMPQILSGDGRLATSSLAHRLGIARFAARQSPADKLAALRSLQQDGSRVLAVGDGINDAPLLSAADVSAAMPKGSALAQARADLLLIGDSLLGLPRAIRIGRLARRRIRENLLWAAAYNLSVVPLAALGLLTPWMAAAGMSASSLLVAMNALRLGREENISPTEPRPPRVQKEPAGWPASIS